MLESAGLDGVTLHPRLVSDKLKRRARWSYIKDLKRAVTIPVIGNGDVETVEDCHRMLDETGCDGVMVGREVVRRPWFFDNVVKGTALDPTAATREQLFSRTG